ncbi:hypothetical protein EVC37_02980 [Methylocaldum sp. BRCS4]|jgi:hypothetical protein|nr:hypothetical protein [Methylocaldum sp. BRCS4]
MTIETATEILRSIAEPHNSPRSRVEVVVELLDGARELDRRIDALRQTAAMLLREMSALEREAVARRRGGDWTAEALGWLADGGRHARRR